MFFPEQGESANPGKKICVTCSVRPECEAYQKRMKNTDGIWAGGVVGRDGKINVRQLGGG